MGEMQCEPCRGTGLRSVLMENILLNQISTFEGPRCSPKSGHYWEDMDTYERCWSCGFIHIKPGVLENL